MSSEIEKKRLKELAMRASFTWSVCYTRFMEPAMAADIAAAAREAGVKSASFGGFEDAERRIYAFFSDLMPENAQYPLRCLKLSWNEKFCDVGHRDLLGAAMGLGLERDSIGDIAIGAQPGCAYLFVHADVQSYVEANLESAGRAKLKVQMHPEEVQLRPPQGETVRITVSAQRLDAVVAAGYKLSRAQAQKLISSGMVKRNHTEELRGDVHVDAGDLLSVRGFGRMRVNEIVGETRKGRRAMLLFRYSK